MDGKPTSGFTNSATTIPLMPPAAYSPAALANGVNCGASLSVIAPTIKPAPNACVVSPIIPDFRNEPNLPLALPNRLKPLETFLLLLVLRLAIGLVLDGLVINVFRLFVFVFRRFMVLILGVFRLAMSDNRSTNSRVAGV